MTTPVQPLTNGNDTRTITGGNLSIALDGLGGFDTLNLGTQGQDQFVITKSADGAVHVDTVSGASEFFHATLFNFEQLVFGDGTSINLLTFFGPPAPPPLTATLVPTTQGPVAGNVSYTLAFSDSVSGLIAGDFSVSNGSVVAVNGSGANYTVVVAPAANTTGNLGLTLNASSVTGAGGGAFTTAVSAAAVAVDTQPPSFVAGAPATSVPVNGSIALSFSEAIQKGSGTVIVKDDLGAVLASYDIASSPQVSLSGKTLSVALSGLVQGSHYTLELPAGGVKDLVGNSLGSVVDSGFSTTGLTPTIVGTPAADTLVGTVGNDVFEGGGGNDSIDGGAGTDTAIYRGKLADYKITLATTADGVTQVTDNRGPLATPGEGSDSLTHVERLQFADQSLALDMAPTQAGGKAALMMAVATSLGPVFDTLPTWAGLFIHYFDSGASLLDGANLLVASGIAAAFAGGPDNASLVKMLYTDVNGVAPDAATLASLVAPLNAGTTTQAQFMANMAASQANQDHVHLTGLAQTGWAFVF
jgi:hypothetical protein